MSCYVPNEDFPCSSNHVNLHCDWRFGFIGNNGYEWILDMGIMASFAHFTLDILLILNEVNTWQVCYIYIGKIPIRYGYYIQLDKFFNNSKKQTAVQNGGNYFNTPPLELFMKLFSASITSIRKLPCILLAILTDKSPYHSSQWGHLL